MSRLAPARHALRDERPFPVARRALVLVVCIIAYASLRPFHGWRAPVVDLESVLRLPGRGTLAFDGLLNVVGYVPFGLCLALAAYPALRGARAFALGTLGPMACSLLVEVGQAFLPGRVPSLVDVATNTFGAMGGAAAAVLLTPWLADHRGGGQLRARYLVPGRATEAGLLVLGAWCVAQFAQGTLLFGVGDWRRNLQVQVDPAVPDAVYFVVEASVVAANVAVVGVLLRLVLADGVVRGRWLIAALGLGLVLRLVAQWTFWGSTAPWRWVTAANTTGIALGLALAWPMLSLGRRRAAQAGLALLAFAVALVNLAPPDPALWQQRTSPREGLLIALVLVARYSAKAWPLAAAGFLWWAWRKADARYEPGVLAAAPGGDAGKGRR